MTPSSCARRPTSAQSAVRDCGIEPGRRLVEEEDLRPVHESEREVEPPLHPARVRAHLAVGCRLEPHALEQLVRPLLALGAGDAVQRRLEAQVLAAREQRVERGFLEGSADGRAHLRALLDDVEAGDARAAVGRRQQRREHVHGRRLAGAVRSQEAVDLAFGDDEVDPVHGADVLEVADEPLRLDAVRHLPTLATSCVVLASGRDELLEEAQVVAVLRVPEHAERERSVSGLQRLDRPVVGPRDDLEPLAEPAVALVVVRRDLDAVAYDRVQPRALVDGARDAWRTRPASPCGPGGRRGRGRAARGRRRARRSAPASRGRWRGRAGRARGPR